MVMVAVIAAVIPNGSRKFEIVVEKKKIYRTIHHNKRDNYQKRIHRNYLIAFGAFFLFNLLHLWNPEWHHVRTFLLHTYRKALKL